MTVTHARARPPWAAGPDEVLAALGVDPRLGLTDAEVLQRQAQHGRNTLPPPERDPLARRLARQLREPMVLLLVAAAAVSGLLLREFADAVAILAIVVANAVIAVAQEGRAARALEALEALEAPSATVRRNGRPEVVAAADLVPGDLVLLGAGDRVPADLRLVVADGLEHDESLLTGESLPAAKSVAAVAEDVAAADRRNMALGGTLVTRGLGAGVVVATGDATAIGTIATALRDARREPTPLQRSLARLGRTLGLAAVVIASAVFVLVVLRTGASSESLQTAFLSAVALAVAAVPEGLAAVTTIALALGVRRMASRGAIIRRLPAVETLGAADVLVIDKTGTVTENRMRVDTVLLGDGSAHDAADVPAPIAAAARRVAAVCNDASLDPQVGDPTEVALLEWVGGEEVRRLRDAHPRRSVVPFDADRRRMDVAADVDGRVRSQVKGAAEVVLRDCRSILDRDGRPVRLNDDTRARLLARADALAAEGARCLALAAADDPDGDLVAVAILGLRDPVRAHARDAVRAAGDAGIRIVMATGDHPGTARHVADEISVDEVHARVDPDAKLALVESLQAEGHVVAMTGDGVNDAPALRRAAIGVALGARGSDVAVEAADMVITDDDLATIVAAVGEGRTIYDDVRKVVDYLVSGNLAEIVVVVTGLLFVPALGIPLLPLQLLWINLLTDGLPAVALGVDPPDVAVMHRPPRAPDERLLSRARLVVLGRRAALLASAPLAGLWLARAVWGLDWDVARTVLFSTLVVAQIAYAYAVRIPLGSRPRGARDNPALVAATLAGLALQAVVVMWPAAHEVFSVTGLGAREWLAVLGLGSLPTALLLLRAGTRRR